MPFSAHTFSENRTRRAALGFPHILHVADVVRDSDRTRSILADAGLAGGFASSADSDPPPAALNLAYVDVVLCEISLASPQSFAVLARLRDTRPGVPVLFLDSVGETPAAVESRRRLPDAVRAVLGKDGDSGRPSSPSPDDDQPSACSSGSASGSAHDWHALRRFAQGVAHDFNNLLTVINGHTSVLLMRKDASGEIMDALQQVYAAGERGAGLTRRLLAFSRDTTVAPRPLDLNEGIRDFTATLGSTLGKNIVLELALDPALPGVNGDADLFEQVLQNLALRARAAMRGEGRLLIRTTSVDLSAAGRLPAPRRPGRFCRLSVSDSGPGIAAELMPRVFEPFAAERKAGDDTGLCLATVWGVVDNHGGWIEVENHPGSGATFHVFLPALPGAAPSATAALVSEPQFPRTQGGETILVVEDDAPVREFVRAALKHHGYRVLLAPSGKEALETWRWHSARIRLLLTDLVLPDDFNGLDLARMLRADKPDLKVLCTSGCTHEALAHPAAVGIGFLQKPYQIQLLTQAVRECLDHP